MKISIHVPKLALLTVLDISLLEIFRQIFLAIIPEKMYLTAKVDAIHLQSKYISSGNKISLTQLLNLLIEGTIVVAVGLLIHQYSFSLPWEIALVLLTIGIVRSISTIAAVKRWIWMQALFINVLTPIVGRRLDLNVRIGSALYWLFLHLYPKALGLYLLDILSIEQSLALGIYYTLSILIMAPVATRYNEYKALN